MATRTNGNYDQLQLTNGNFNGNFNGNEVLLQVQPQLILPGGAEGTCWEFAGLSWATYLSSS